MGSSPLLLAFAGLLLVAVLVSERANRTVLSTAVLFLIGGFVLGPGMLGVLSVEADGDVVRVLAELALFAVLFSDGMKVGVRDLRRAWRLPSRALLLGLPLTLALTAVFAHYLVDLPWLESFLLGAVLAPTDPVFAAAIVGRKEVPARLRHVLNVESGVNDGLALPIVLVLIAMAGGAETTGWLLVGELGLGIVVGVVVPAVVLALDRLPFLSARKGLEPLLAASIGLLVLAICLTTHANLFLGAFTAGVMVASFGGDLREEFEEFGDLVNEQLKLAAILVFGALITPALLFEEIGWTGWLLAVLALVVARPAALVVSFLGSGLSGREQLAAMWFGPKGFASVVYALLVLDSGIARAGTIYHLAAVAIALSIVAHSSSDVLVARQFRTLDDEPAGTDRGARDRGPAERSA